MHSGFNLSGEPVRRIMTKLKSGALVLVLIVGTTEGLSATAVGEPEKAQAKAPIKWEYKAHSYDEIKLLEFNKRGMDTRDYGLNMLGDEGWELVAIEPPVPGPIPNFGGRPALYVFKRLNK